MTCRQLRGACDTAFHAETFAQISDMCMHHAMAMAQAGDTAHIAKMAEMKNLPPEAQQAWFAQAQQDFAALPEDSLDKPS